jgi:uncharacterized protein YndB with AHSA1/START domain
MQNEPLVFERTYNVSVEKLWSALSDKDEMKKWYFDLPEFKAEKGFEFEFLAGDDKQQWLHKCRVTEAIPNKKLSYTWRYDGYEGDSEVSFELFPEGDKTKLILTHKGLDSFPAQLHPGLAKNNFVIGWTDFLDKQLKNYLGS